ncbi:MAG: NHLP bacteriocin system secretion protein [Anaerolineae bacterium]
MSRLFRQVTLERLSSPEQLDYVMRIVSPKGWLALLGLAGLLAVALLWAFLGTVPVLVHGTGILISTGGIGNIVAPVGGELVAIDVKVGDLVEVGQGVAQIQTDAGTWTAITSPYQGRVVELTANKGDSVEHGTPLLSVEIGARDKNNLEGVIYVAPADGKKIKPDMLVQIEPATVKHETYGYLMGKVVSVSPFPVTQQEMLRVLGSQDLARTFSTQGTPIEVRVALTPAQTPSGYQWSSRIGPPDPVNSGTFSTALVKISEQRVLSLILPVLR